jgi:hypothetical protein
MRQLRFRCTILCLGLGTWVLSVAADYTSPSAALKSLEAAYIHNDIEAAVAARDFAAEAREMLLVISKGDTTISKDPGILKQTADVLEKGYRLEMKSKGFPPMATLQCQVLEQAPKRPDLVPMVETCIWPDKSRSTETVYAIKTPAGWKIINLPAEGA